MKVRLIVRFLSEFTLIQAYRPLRQNETMRCAIIAWRRVAARLGMKMRKLAQSHCDMRRCSRPSSWKLCIVVIYCGVKSGCFQQTVKPAKLTWRLPLSRVTSDTDFTELNNYPRTKLILTRCVVLSPLYHPSSGWGIVKLVLRSSWTTVSYYCLYLYISRFIFLAILCNLLILLLVSLYVCTL